MKKKEKAILIGKTIKRMRDLKGITQGDLAFDSDLERSFLSGLETNKKALPFIPSLNWLMR